MSVFKNEYTRVSKIDEPLLIIGLGGSGLDGLLHIKDLFSKRLEMEKDPKGKELNHPPKTAYLEIDTDSTALQKSCNGTMLESSEFIDLTDTNLEAKLNNPQAYLKPYQSEWLDDLYIKTFSEGAGGIRQAGRLMLMLKAQDVYNQLMGRIRDLVSVAAGAAAPPNRITIIVIAGLSGGTGSGTFLDVPYMIRHIMNRSFTAYQYDISGYLVTPDVHVAVAAKGNSTKQQGFESNGFAALKELDYWMGADSHRHPFVQQYTDGVEVDWSAAHPYDDVTLLSAELVGGAIISNPAEAIYNLLAENMLNYMSYEPKPTGTAGNDFTYKQHKINVTKDVKIMSKPYPSNYCYTAIGVASTHPQQDQMIDYEASLLMEKMVVLADNQPDPTSTEAEDFAQEVLNLEGAYDRAKSRAPLPEWASEKATHSDAETMRDGGNAYHVMTENGELYNWQKRVAVPQMKAFFFGDPNDENMHGELRDIWKRFTDAAKKIILDHAKGPYYLEALLDGDHGVIKQVEKRLADVNGKKGTLDTEIAHQHDSAEQELKSTKKAGWLTKGIEMVHIGASPFGRYIDQCATLYENVRRRAYVAQQATLLEELKNWLQGYMKASLHVYNQTMTDLNSALGSSVGAAGDTADSVASFAQLRASIDERFKAADEDGAMFRHMLDLIAEQSLTYVGGDNAKPKEKKRFERDIEHFINETFRTMNAANLDAMLAMDVGDDSVQRVNKVINTWAPQLDGAATPMFASLAGMAGDEVVPFAYVSVPDNAGDFKAGIQQYTTTRNISVTLKDSGVRERVMWLNTYNGLPLCRYAMLANMEKTYENILTQPSGTGIHLIGGKAAMEWKDLPSPIPHELLNIAMSSRVKAEHDKAMDVLNRAMETGMLTISRINSSYDLRFLTANGAEPSSDDFDVMLKNLKAGDDDAANVEKIDYWAKKPQDIGALIASGALSQQTVNGDYKKFAGIHGFIQSDYVHQEGETQERRKRVDDNIALLNKDLVLYTLSKRPYTVARIEKQLAFFDKLNAYRADCAAKQAALQEKADAAAAALQARDKKRSDILTYSEDVAKMIMFELIRYKMGKGYIVQDEEYWPDGKELYKPGNEVALEMRTNCRDILLVRYLQEQEMDGDKELLHQLVASRMEALGEDEASWPAMKARCEKLKGDWQTSIRKLRASDKTFERDEREWLISVYDQMIMAMDEMIGELG